MRVILFVLSALLFAALIYMTITEVYGCNTGCHHPVPSPVCDNGEHVGNPHCSPSPSISISPIPSPSQEASPSATPTTDSGVDGSVAPPALVDYNLCTYRDCSVHPIVPGISDYDGSKVGEK